MGKILRLKMMFTYNIIWWLSDNKGFASSRTRSQMKTMKMKKLSALMLILVMAFLSVGSTGCAVTKSDFHKKKWKIRKSHPPVQRYYNKWRLFDQHRD